MKFNKENRTGEIRLGSAHSLMNAHKPNIVDLKKFAEEMIGSENVNTQNFGLFDSSTPNYATYYPDVSAEDLTPKEDEFINPTFRMLSETIVYKGAPIDFGKTGVLKASMSLLLGQSINIDHETAVGNAIGAVSDTFWQGAYKDSKGKLVPAGINAILKIDGKSNPRISRGIMMSPPSIHSNSVTVKFGWEPSHKFENDSEFFDKLGTYTKKGELIRIVVNLIKSYHETSLVSHGADPYAQKVGADGKIINPEYASRQYSFSADKPISGFVEVDYKTEEFSLSNDKAIPTRLINISNNNDNPENMEEILKDLASEFGFEEKDLTTENVVEKLKGKLDEAKLEDNSEKLTKLEADKAQLETDLIAEQEAKTQLEADLTKATFNKTLLETVTKNTRDEAVKNFKLAKGDNADQSIISLISNAEYEGATAFLKEYSKEADAKFAPTCNKCGSDDVSRAKAKTSTDGLVNKDEDQDPGVGNRTSTDVRNRLRAKNRKTSRLFNKDEE